MKLVLLTSISQRHKYISSCLNKEFDLKLIITEEKSASITNTSEYNAQDESFMKNHFKARAESELKFFKNFDFPKNVLLEALPFKGINAERTAKLIDEVKPDIIVLFGTSIISDSLLEMFPNNFINLHLGLSPYYKGSATNLFPYYFNEPECVGATIHIATAKVDAGAILHQIRPDIEIKDDLHTIGNKVIQKAGEILPKILIRYHNKDIIPQSQSQSQYGNGKVCRIKDLSPKVLRSIYNKFE